MASQGPLLGKRLHEEASADQIPRADVEAAKTDDTDKNTNKRLKVEAESKADPQDTEEDEEEDEDSEDEDSWFYERLSRDRQVRAREDAAWQRKHAKDKRPEPSQVPIAERMFVQSAVDDYEVESTQLALAVCAFIRTVRFFESGVVVRAETRTLCPSSIGRLACRGTNGKLEIYIHNAAFCSSVYAFPAVLVPSISAIQREFGLFAVPSCTDESDRPDFVLTLYKLARAPPAVAQPAAATQ